MTGGASGSSVREQGNVPLQCPKLTDTNYTTWAPMMETILKAYGLWKVIDAKKETDGKKKTDDEQETAIDEKAENTRKGMIFQTLPQDMLMQVAHYTTAKEVWNSIKVKYLGADLVQKARLQTLRSELETLKMKPHESASEFAGKLSSIQAKFKSLGGTLKDKVLVRKLLNSVPKKFLPIVASIEQYQEIDTMQFEEAVGRITAFEERLKSQDEPENNYQDKLLMASSNNKSYGKWRGKDFNKETKESMKWKNNPNAPRASTSQGTKDKSKLRCYECGEHGHFAKECTNWKDKKKDKEQEALLISEDTAFVITGENVGPKPKPGNHNPLDNPLDKPQDQNDGYKAVK
ncbi:zinc finger, CCHC-type containing protein [Tanacetum coccineum]